MDRTINIQANTENLNEWVRQSIDLFRNSNYLDQNLAKRPDLIAKVNRQIIIGEAKWIGQQPGGNQEKQVQEVLNFCRHQRGNVIRIGVVDGFPWSVFNINHRLVNNKEAVNIQESEYDLVSALLLQAYLQRFL